MRRTIVWAILVGCISLSGCATGPGTKTDGGAPQALSLDLVKIPAKWELAGEKSASKAYSANLVSEKGTGRVLLGRMEVNRMGLDRDAYIARIHSRMVERIRGRIDMSPYSEDRVEWSNGVEGLRTLMRGELDGAVTIIEGTTVVDDRHAYFVYGLFPEKNYESLHASYTSMLSSLAPIRGVKRGSAAGVAGLMGSDTTTATATTEVRTKTRDSLVGTPGQQFREFVWGSTKDKVKIVEGNPTQESSKALLYSCSLFETESCNVVYIFTQDKLQQGAYVFAEVFNESSAYLKSYAKVGRELAKAYGDPVQRAAVWSSEELKEDRARWGDALVRGDVVFGTVWKMGGAKVIHVMRSNGVGGIEHRVTVNGPT